jgi:type 1 glutamine amidotransferase
MDVSSPFRTLVVASKDNDHLRMSTSAGTFLARMGEENGFTVDFTLDAEAIDARNLEQYRVFVMMHLAPFEMSYAQQDALRAFVESGKGWVGVHAAGLAGKEFIGSGTRYWQWYEELLGGVTYSPHPGYQEGTVLVEDRVHPATRNLPDHFELFDEWYEFNGNPRGQTHVLAVADETTYTPNKPMGDHPIVWTNERYRRAIYIGLGHDASALDNEAYAILLRDSILWAASA